MATLLKTGIVAQMLGVSRQHVVDMCDRGEMACVRVGTHRRVPLREVENITSKRLTREEERSLWLHRAVVPKLLVDQESVISKARENLRHWRGLHRQGGMTLAYFTMWERVLNGGLDAIVEVMTSRSEEARDMRQNSPFAGSLSDKTRARVLRSFNEHWTRDHEQAKTT